MESPRRPRSAVQVLDGAPIDWKGGKGAVVVEEVKDAVPGIANSEWEVVPLGPSSLDPAFFVYVDNAWTNRLTETAAEHGIDALAANPNLALDDHDGAAHLIRGQSTVTAAYFDGQVLKAVCGHRFIPQADPSAAPLCPECGAQTDHDGRTKTIP